MPKTKNKQNARNCTKQHFSIGHTISAYIILRLCDHYISFTVIVYSTYVYLFIWTYISIFEISLLLSEWCSRSSIEIFNFCTFIKFILFVHSSMFISSCLISLLHICIDILYIWMCEMCGHFDFYHYFPQFSSISFLTRFFSYWVSRARTRLYTFVASSFWCRKSNVYTIILNRLNGQINVM